VDSQCHAPAALPPGKRRGTQCTEGWVGPRDHLDSCGKSRSAKLKLVGCGSGIRNKPKGGGVYEAGTYILALEVGGKIPVPKGYIAR
jgi:hypothetical protein